MLIGIILISIGLLISFIASDCDPRVLVGRVLVGVILVSAGVMFFIFENHPTAMDVYQGKTTLEITYKNGIAIDSVVVFKDKEK